MVNMGTDEILIDDNDGWTVYTADGMPSAQWEVMALVASDAYETFYAEQNVIGI